MDLRVSSTIPRTENSKTKVDIQSLKFVDTPAAENQNQKWSGRLHFWFLVFISCRSVPKVASGLKNENSKKTKGALG